MSLSLHDDIMGTILFCLLNPHSVNSGLGISHEVFLPQKLADTVRQGVISHFLDDFD